MTAGRRQRCGWVGSSELERSYHDSEWGVPLHDDRRLFEYLILEGAQAGLSWRTILNKRAGYRLLFDDFDADKIARYTPARIERLLGDARIVRNRLKVNAAVANARALLELQAAHGSFDHWLWRFVDGQPIQNRWQHLAEVPARTPLSDRLSRELKRCGFKFVGSTICYAFLQATGLVNDHTVDCFRHRQLGG